MKPLLMSNKQGGKAPQCKVCGDESSGFHYGVDSCEGCKGFFRRCITQGMNHKCANEEKCDITPFTRNSCQYCRLKKCFEVGMSREASRLGRRPKRLKDVNAESSGGGRTHTSTLPIAPYHTSQDMYKMRMAELQKVLQDNGTFKAELMQAFLAAAKTSFQEHSKSSTEGKCVPHRIPSSQRFADSGCVNANSSCFSGSNCSLKASSMSSETIGGNSTKAEGVGMMGGVIGGMYGMDSPSSLHSPGGTSIDISNFVLDNFLFDSATPGGSTLPSALDTIADMHALNSPFPFANVALDHLSNTTSPLSDLGITTSPNSVSISNGCGSNDTKGSSSSSTSSPCGHNVNNYSQNVNFCTPNVPQRSPDQGAHAVCPQQDIGQSAYGGQLFLPTSSLYRTVNRAYVKCEPTAGSSCHDDSHSVHVKMEPLSPIPLPSPLPGCVFQIKFVDPKADYSCIDLPAIMDEVRQKPSEERRLLMEQVTDALVEAHLSTNINTYEAIEEANKKIYRNSNSDLPDMSVLTINPSNMWKAFLTNMVPEIHRLVQFCKKLPGFMEIDQDDQIRLIKQGSFEVMLARFSLLVDESQQTLLDPSMTLRAHRSVIREMPMGEFLDEFFFMAAHFNPLNLTDGEIGLFTAVLMICPDRVGLSNVRPVAKIQSLFRQALYYMIRYNHPEPDTKFCQLMSLIPIFRRINDAHFKAVNSMRMQQDDCFPELHKEMFSEY